jgi:hypothetical protein
LSFELFAISYKLPATNHPLLAFSFQLHLPHVAKKCTPFAAFNGLKSPMHYAILSVE